MATQARGGRQVILDAAVHLYAKVGYHGTSIRDIASEADVTAASIYYHFKSKQDILQAIMVTILDDVTAETREALSAADDRPDAQLAALVKSWVLFHIRRQPEAFIGASEIRSLDDEGRLRIIAQRDELEGMFLSVVERGVTEGVFHTPFPREAARAIVTLGRSVVAWYRIGGQTSPEGMADQYAELSLAMLRTE